MAQGRWDLWLQPWEPVGAWTSGTWMGSGSWSSTSGLQMTSSGFDPGKHLQALCGPFRSYLSASALGVTGRIPPASRSLSNVPSALPLSGRAREGKEWPPRRPMIERKT